MRGLVWGRAETEEEDSWSKAVSLEGWAGASRSLRGHIKDGEPMKHFCLAGELEKEGWRLG